MITADLGATRNATWAPTLVYGYSGGPLPAIGHVAMQLRLYPGAADPALLTINPIAYADAAAPTAADPLARTLTLSPVITPAQLATLPGLNTPEAGKPQTFSFDIRVTYADSTAEVIHAGNFILLPGTTTA